MWLKTLYYRGSLKSCNYSCPYCPFRRKNASKGDLAHDREALERFCEKAPTMGESLGDSVSVMLVPYGEAMIHSYYHEAVMRLCKAENIDKVGFQSNLSFSVEGFLGRLRGLGDGLRKLRLWCTFHPCGADPDQFLEKCLLLYRNGIRFSVGAVGLPKNIKSLAWLRRQLPSDIYMWVNAVEGMRREYTQDEVDGFLRIDPLFGYELSDHPADPGLCTGGKESVFVEANGDVFACPISKKRLGNIYSGQGFAEQDYAGQALSEQACAGQAITEQDYAGQSISGQTAAEQGLSGQAIIEQGHAGQAITEQACAGQTYAGQAYAGQAAEHARKGSTICRARSCHCYLAYSNRGDIFDVSGLDEGRAFRIPNRQRVFFFDVDGTLTDGAGEIPPENIQAIERIAQSSLVFLATSLPYSFAARTCGGIWQHISGGVFAEGSDIRIFPAGFKRIIPLDESILAALPAGAKFFEYREDGVLHKVTLQTETEGGQVLLRSVAQEQDSGQASASVTQEGRAFLRSVAPEQGSEQASASVTQKGRAFFRSATPEQDSGQASASVTQEGRAFLRSVAPEQDSGQASASVTQEGRAFLRSVAPEQDSGQASASERQYSADEVWDDTYIIEERVRESEETQSVRCVLEDGTCGIVSSEATKLNGIIEICRRLRIFEPFVTVVGNSRNDIPMLKHFPNSVCVPGSDPEVMNAAKSCRPVSAL